MTEQATDKAQFIQKGVQLNWAQPGLAIFANNLHAQFDGYQSMFLTFAQVSPPIITAPTPEEMKQRMDHISSLVAMPVARVVMPIENLRMVIAGLQAQLDAIENMKKGKS